MRVADSRGKKKTYHSLPSRFWTSAYIFVKFHNRSETYEGILEIALWFESGIPPKGSCAEGLTLNAAVFRGGALGKWLGHKGSDLIYV